MDSRKIVDIISGDITDETVDAFDLNSLKSSELFQIWLRACSGFGSIVGRHPFTRVDRLMRECRLQPEFEMWKNGAYAVTDYSVVQYSEDFLEHEYALLIQELGSSVAAEHVRIWLYLTESGTLFFVIKTYQPKNEYDVQVGHTSHVIETLVTRSNMQHWMELAFTEHPELINQLIYRLLRTINRAHTRRAKELERLQNEHERLNNMRSRMPTLTLMTEEESAALAATKAPVDPDSDEHVYRNVLGCEHHEVRTGDVYQVEIKFDYLTVELYAQLAEVISQISDVTLTEAPDGYAAIDNLVGYCTAKISFFAQSPDYDRTFADGLRLLELLQRLVSEPLPEYSIKLTLVRQPAFDDIEALVAQRGSTS